ncbi:MAG TPA: hypothetical protein ENI85_18905 [Deltaproteobacteria bacterium]|nr:hypothetical protein [Deltaproteobacteria bacterium]
MDIVRLDLPGKGGGEGSPEAEAARIEALRLRAAEALERAYRFLENQGDSWALLRAQVLCEARPPSAVSDRMTAIQAPDGHLPIGTLVSGGAAGFPAIDPGRLESADRALVGTLEALLVAADARTMHAGWVEPAVRYLEAIQRKDGSFRLEAQGGDGSGSSSPADPQSEAFWTAFWTGMVAGVLGRTPLSRPACLDPAGDYLAARFEPGLVEGEAGYPALLAISHFFTNVAHDLSDEVLQWCGRALEKGFRSRQIDAVATLRVLLTCDAQAMPGASFDVTELLEGVLAEQAGDGGFAELSPGGPAARTTQTFDAMLALVRLCGALGE